MADYEVLRLPKCRNCKIPLIPPDPNKKYRTIKCGKCNEVTPVGPPPEEKKYVLCSCNTLLIIPDDATLFTCTRCKKIRRADQEINADQKLIADMQRPPSNSPMLKAHSFGVVRTSSVGTMRGALYRTVSMQSVSLEDVPRGIEASSGTISAKTSPTIPHFAQDLEAVDDIESTDVKLHEDQKFILNFLAVRVRPSVIKYIDGNKFWFMRLKVLLNILYNIIISVLVLSNYYKHEFFEQFGFRTYDTWLAAIVFSAYIGSFSVEWAFNKIFIYGHLFVCMWYGIWAFFDPLKRTFFWNFYDTGHLLEEVMMRSFYLRIPRLKIPFYRFFNPPQNSTVESEFYYLSDIHLLSLFFHHPKIHTFFKVCLGFALLVKTLGKAGCIAALILLPYNPYTIIYTAETFVSALWMFFFWAATNKGC